VSGHASRRKSAAERLIQLVALLSVFGLMWGASHLTGGLAGTAGLVAAVGFLILGGMLASELFEVVGLPHLSGYLLVGVVAGPHVTHLVAHSVVRQLEVVNVLALALIALAGGVELRVEVLRQVARTLTWTTLTQALVGLLLMTAVFFGLSPWLPFLQGQSGLALAAISVLWAVLSLSRSPSALLGILSQTRASGPVSRFSLAFVMSSDVVVVVLLALAVTLSKPLLSPGGSMSLEALVALGHELVGSVTLGTTLGLLIALYLRVAERHVLLLLMAVGFGVTEAVRYLRFDPLLTFLLAGFVVQNATQQGPKLLAGIERTGGIVFVLFFAIAGAHLDLPLLGQLWPVALGLCSARVVAAVVGHRLGAKLAREQTAVRQWGWVSLVSQAGLTLGLSVLIEKAFPSFGSGFRSLAIATVAINEMVGPIIFKVALDRLGESGRDQPVGDAHPEHKLTTGASGGAQTQQEYEL
jgi:Kef-type K+ transport system membrane component KefB